MKLAYFNHFLSLHFSLVVHNRQKSTFNILIIYHLIVELHKHAGILRTRKKLSSVLKNPNC